MKTLKVFSLTLLMSVVFAGMTFAQEQKRETAQLSPEERAAKRIEMMRVTLNLTPEQVAKLQELSTQFAQKREQMGQDIKAQKEAYDAQLKMILTPEQYQKYQEQRKQRLENKLQVHKTKMATRNGEKFRKTSKEEVKQEVKREANAKKEVKK